mmetsp:Transcript_5997/g.10898  ORF Transcript_5997/g.10898 Transcript_5997/m.10898 type:complete len:98 (-) Transcript_5997:134-427(-)
MSDNKPEVSGTVLSHSNPNTNANPNTVASLSGIEQNKAKRQALLKYSADRSLFLSPGNFAPSAPEVAVPITLPIPITDSAVAPTQDGRPSSSQYDGR